MSKYKLAEYEGKRRLSGTGFLLENASGNKVERHYHHFFVDKKWRCILWLSLWCILVGIMGAVSGSLAGTSYYRSLSSGIEPDQERNVYLGHEREEKVKEELQEISLLEEFFLAVEKSDGKITALEWKSDGAFEELNASLSGVYPEILQKLAEVSKTGQKGQSAVYKNGIPQISVSYNNKLKNYSTALYVPQTTTLAEDNDASLFYKSVREEIVKAGGLLKEEKSSPYQIDFVYRAQNGVALRRLLLSLSKVLKTAGQTVTLINIQKSGREEMRFIMSIEKVAFGGFDLQFLSDKLELFIDKKESGNVQAYGKLVVENKHPDDRTEKSGNVDSFVKLGEIRKSDNSLVVFYKNTEGKIQKEIKVKEVN